MLLCDCLKELILSLVPCNINIRQKETGSVSDLSLSLIRGICNSKAPHQRPDRAEGRAHRDEVKEQGVAYPGNKTETFVLFCFFSSATQEQGFVCACETRY